MLLFLIDSHLRINAISTKPVLIAAAQSLSVFSPLSSCCERENGQYANVYWTAKVQTQVCVFPRPVFVFAGI